MTQQSTVRAGVIGLGLMGGPIATNILAAGIPVSAYDVDSPALDVAVGRGARRAADAADVAGDSDVVLVIVPTADDVRDVCLGARGVFAGSRPGTVVVLMSSLQPDTCEELALLAEPVGVTVIDAPMTGGIRAAVDGTMMLVVGGDAEALDHARPVLDAISTHVHHLGPVGAGQVGKLVNNLIHWGEVVVLTEALSLAAALGVRVSALREALMDGPTDSRHLRELGLMKFTWHRKDLADVLQLAESIGREVPAARFSQERMLDITPERVLTLLEDRGWELPERDGPTEPVG